MRRSVRTGWYIAACVALSFTMTVLGLEVLLLFMPVSDGLRGVPVNADNPVYRFAPNRRLRWSKGWNFSLVNDVRVNNEGFISTVDYDPEATSPLLAVIGDSFVEALMVPYAQTAAGILGESVEGEGRVYSFGASGAALSQYLAYAAYVQRTFKPVGLVITIVGNDFDESLLKYRSYPGFHYFVESQGGLELKRIDRSVPWWKDVVVKSTLGRYIIMNLEAGNVLERLNHGITAIFGGKRHFVGNVDATVNSDRLADARKAVDAFLRSLPVMSQLDPSQVALVIDATRPDIYQPERARAAEHSFFGQMRTYLIGEASAKGFEIIDLQNIFTLDYQKRGRLFEHTHDYHWNGTGHAVVAEAIRRSCVYQRIFLPGHCIQP